MSSAEDEEELQILLEDADRRSYGAVDTVAGIVMAWKWFLSVHWTIQVLIAALVIGFFGTVFAIVHVMLNGNDVARRNVLLRNMLIVSISCALYAAVQYNGI